MTAEDAMRIRRHRSWLALPVTVDAHLTPCVESQNRVDHRREAMQARIISRQPLSRTSP